MSYLSDAYERIDGEPNLELKVITLNINDGHNRELMEQCHTLKEYAQYVTRVRSYAKEMKLDEADRQAAATEERLSHESVFKNVRSVIHGKF